MRLIDYIDKGASLGTGEACLVMNDTVLSYGGVQRLTYQVARGLDRAGIAAGEHVAILSDNDPIAFACVFAISRAGCVWCPINPRNQMRENGFILDNFDCSALFFHSRFRELIESLQHSLLKLRLLICLDMDLPFAPSLATWLKDLPDTPFERASVSDLAMIPGTGGTTGVPKGVMLSHRNIETMSAITLIAYPFGNRPTYLAMAPLTHAAGVLALPIFSLGGRVVIMAQPDLDRFLALIERHGVTHTFLPPTLIYMLLDKPELDRATLSTLRCFWYGAAPMSAVRLEEALRRIGPMAQLFGQTEAPMMISTMSPAEHRAENGTVRTDRLASAGRAAPLVQLGIMGEDGRLLGTGEVGEIVVKSSLVMMGYYKNAEATAESQSNGWHRTGDIGYLDKDCYLFIVDRAKDMIITGGFNVYSAEVERALMLNPGILDCAVFGLPDPKWGEQVCAVVEMREGMVADVASIRSALKQEIGSVKTPKLIEIWPKLPRSTVGKVLKKEIRAHFLIDRVEA